MKKNLTKVIAVMLLMGGILIGGISTTVKAIDPPGTEPNIFISPATQK